MTVSSDNQHTKAYLGDVSFRETNKKITFIKSYFEEELMNCLNLEMISCPLFLKQSSGLNDLLNGVERPVRFDAKGVEGMLEVVQSLAKWKRHALWRMKFGVGEGLITRMNAIRRDEELSPIHSILVTQWDWEKVITCEQRNQIFLRQTVMKIYNAILKTENEVHFRFGIPKTLPPEIAFISTTELETKYPDLSPREREHEIAKKYGAVFLMEIGGNLPNSGKYHDGRAADYDDWSLNGDIIVWNKKLNTSFELSSMGVRVDSKSLVEQLDIRGESSKLSLPFHNSIIEKVYPMTMGGGIGQCRLCMFFLQAYHIGEVHPGAWPELETKDNFME